MGHSKNRNQQLSREEVLDDLKKIAELANDIWRGWATTSLSEALEIKRIAEELIEKVQD